MIRLARWFRRSRPLVGGPAAPAPSPAEVAPRVHPRTFPRPSAPPVFDVDPGRTPVVDPMLWSVIRPINSRRTTTPEGDPR